MDIFEYTDYKLFLKNLIESMPRRGHGQFRKLALHLEVNSVVISQILSGDRDFTLEQGLRVAKYYGLDEMQADYFLLMILKARAATHDLKLYYQDKLEALSKKSQKIKNRVVKHHELSEGDKSIFYSNWYYAGISLLSAVEGYNDIDSLATYFNLSRTKVREVLDFLISRGLCVEENGKIGMGVSSTHLDASSEYVNNHRRNWRLKAFERFAEPSPDELFYSGPFSLSKEDVVAIRRELAALIGKISKRVANSSSEQLACLNIDFFKF